MMWEEAGVAGENPRVQVGDHHILLHTTTVDRGDRRGDKRVHCLLRYLDTHLFYLI